MDLLNVRSELSDIIRSQIKTLQEAKKRQGQRPHDGKTREQTYTNFMMLFKSRGIAHLKGVVSSSFISSSYLPCSTSTAELKPVAIKNLQLETHHRGTYLLLRSITLPYRMRAIMAVMEDENEDVILLHLYQQEDESDRSAADIINIGTVLLVKEPYFKVMGDGEYGIRVDHRSDVIHLKRDDARIPKVWQPRLIEIQLSAESLKTQGNRSMGEKKYWDAVKEYSDALSQPATANEIETIKRNRSLAFLKTKQFDAALSDTGYPDFSPHLIEKTLFRAAEALYNLERFKECCQVLEQLCSKFPHNSEASMFLGRAQSRIVEQKSGVYNFKELQANAKQLRPPHLDHATYIGPVEIRQTESKGRGLFVTKAVKAGELLLCEKAFSHAHADEGASDGNANIQKMNLLIDPETGCGLMGARADLIMLTVQKLYRNPSLAQAFTTLCHGTYEGVSTATVDGKPIVDTFLTEQILSSNVFSCPVSSLYFHIKDRDQNRGPLGNETTKQRSYHSCGIWMHASYINHSCTSNALPSFIGNMMIVRASCNMEAGSEITLWYHNPTISGTEDSHENHQPWGFTCACAICVDARSTDAVVRRKRQKLLDDLKGVLSYPIDIKKFERLIEATNKTYTQPAKDVPRLLIWEPQFCVVRLYMMQREARKTLESAVKVLTLLGFVVVGADSSKTRFAITKWGFQVEHLVENFFHIRNAFMEMGVREDSLRAEGYAKTTDKILVGEDASFDATYEE